MARGVWSIFPKASYLHAKTPQDIKKVHLKETMILVDSVINSGKSIKEFLTYLEEIDEAGKIAKIFVVAGVCWRGGAVMLRKCYPSVDVFALRMSTNTFKGKGATDTGGRLFNTTQMY